MTGARVAQISISGGGVPKRRVERAEVTADGLRGDAHREDDHGGPDRAVCIWGLERIVALQQEGHPVAPGTAGENLTVAGLDWEGVGPGDELRVGAELVVEVTDYTSPCQTISGSFIDGRHGRISQKKHPGWSRVYARVLTPGTIAEGDTVEHIRDREGKSTDV